MDTDRLQYVLSEDYLMSWKADGTRYMLMIADRHTYLIGRDNTVFHVHPGPWFPRPTWDAKQDPTQYHKVHRNALIDGEMVVDEFKDPKTGKRQQRARYLAYDLIMCGDRRYNDKPYHERLKVLDREVFKPRAKFRAHKDAPTTPEPFSIRLKTFLPVSLATFDKINGMIKKQHITHETDGLIFAKDLEPYAAGTCETLLKWKPPNKNSFDFKVRVEHGRHVVIARLYVGGDGNEEVEFRGTGVSTMECPITKTVSSLNSTGVVVSTQVLTTQLTRCALLAEAVCGTNRSLKFVSFSCCLTRSTVNIQSIDHRAQIQ
eukprot:m.39318 g.39318  ORF g.39318 m.39318 type:complete len:317 (-) comp14706_c0_seq5:826-1776(-)